MNRHLTAAKQIIIREGKPMHIKEITKIAVAEKLINDTKTPEATMGARVGDEIRWLKDTTDTRTPEELLDIIEAKGKEVTEAITLLRKT